MLRAWQLANEFNNRFVLVENQQTHSFTIDLKDSVKVGGMLIKDILIETQDNFDQDNTWSLNIMLPTDQYYLDVTIGLLQNNQWPLGKSCLINFMSNDKIRGTVNLNSQGSTCCKFIIANQQNKLTIQKHDYSPITITD